MLSLVMSACGKSKPQVVTGIQVQSSTVDQDVYLALKTDLDLGDITQVKMAMVQEEEATIKLDYSSQAPSKAKEDKINSMIYNLHKKKAKLQLR